MRILYVCHRIPFPPDKGEKIRAFHHLRAMATRHEVDLFTLADDAQDMSRQTELRDYCSHVTVARLRPRWARLRALPFFFRRTALTVPYFYSAPLEAKIREALGRGSYDRIFVYCSPMAQYVETARGIPKILDLVDVDSDKWRQYAARSRWPFSAVYRREWRLLREYERKVCERSDGVLVTTAREAELVRQISGRIAVHVVPHGVEIPEASLPWEGRKRPTVVFTGDMSYFPNQDAVRFFAREVLPLIQKTIPEARFLVVGRKPNNAILALRRFPGVEVTGSVPEVGSYLAQAHVSVAPFSITAGIPNKILEAMAHGLPVVATPQAVQGLCPEVAESIEIGGSAGELAEKVAGLLRDPERAYRKGLDARNQVAASYQWERTRDGLLRLIENPALPAEEPAIAVPAVSRGA